MKSETNAPKLFEEKPVKITLPALKHNYLDDALHEIELVNFPLQNPFQLVDDEPGKYVTANELQHHVGKTVTMLLYLVTIKESVTKHKELMNFGTFYDPEMNWVDTIHWPAVLKQFPLTGKGFYRITGKVTVNYNVHSIEVIECIKIGIKSRARKADDLFTQIKDYKPGFEPLYQRVA